MVTFNLTRYNFGMAESSNPRHKVVSRRYFDHIKWGGPCPPLNVNLAELVSDKSLQIDQERMASLLAQIMDDMHGTEEIVRNRRKVILVDEYIGNASKIDTKSFFAGSKGDGFLMETSDVDVMGILLDVAVTNPEQRRSIERNSQHKTVLLMRKADCRPGYVALEILQLGEVDYFRCFRNAAVPIGDSMFLSSDIYRQGMIDVTTGIHNFVSNGPCLSLMSTTYGDRDLALAFPCLCWPREANEWIHRARFHGWPSQTMIDMIVQGGCHLVPVGDKCSTDTLLQWRISFACAERLLVHSLTHPQFRVYGLLKYFLSEIKDLLEHITGDSDILCSYFIKTVMFFAVEHSPTVLWHYKNTFLCLRFCLSILIAWVKSGYCPSYFIPNNNLFLRKIHGENRQKLLHFLIDCYDLKWPRMFLSKESIRMSDLEVLLEEYQNLGSKQYHDSQRDLDLFHTCPIASFRPAMLEKNLDASLRLLAVSEADVDEFIAYRVMVTVLCSIAIRSLTENSTTGRNKHKYRALRKSKHLLTPQASMCTSPGLMMLATFHYLTGNYKKTLEMCADLMSTLRAFLLSNDIPKRSRERYQRMNFGQNNTLYHKFNLGIYTCVIFTDRDVCLSVPQLILEIKKHPYPLHIPPLAYATFLSFLCYHDLSDIRRRDTELINLRALSYDSEQGGHEYWIVHTLLGICYQTVGDNRRAIRSFTDSLRVMPEDNPAKVRIESLQSSQ
ncbi:uncharacterized protein LOC110447479 [Mizuhopecten yessoensis]|uniref:Mab-21-like HhH/H2TH-like domain-containing protein n=1 Tax=Mizuhopecten yessoensis TaxID=6573 RepID=A0A210QV88_MIZYE|nr:uncharacterized protein LOC110447479 [Mizuhopecten yessoensis]OWF52651.1 hypothetical protein KP79_PYT20896 [Mizuhopecten yessoensis]